MFSLFSLRKICSCAMHIMRRYFLICMRMSGPHFDDQIRCQVLYLKYCAKEILHNIIKQFRTELLYYTVPGVSTTFSI